MAKKFKIKLVKSVIGCTVSQRATVKALGLGRIGSEATLSDNPANRGQISKVQHLLKVVAEK
jgi:large subunit ribosomal protein L30